MTAKSRKVASGEKKISKDKESKKCPLCFNLKQQCSHGNSIIRKISGLKSPFIGSYNKVLRNIEIPHTKRQAFNDFILKKIDDFANSLTIARINSAQGKKLYKQKMIQGFYNEVLKEAKKRQFPIPSAQKDEDHDQTSDTISMEDSDDESVDLNDFKTDSEYEEDVLEPASKKEILSFMTTPKKTFTTPESNNATFESPTIDSPAKSNENIETPKEKVNTVDNMANMTANKKKVSLTEENTDNGCLALLGKSDCESFSRVKQALELYLKCKIDRLHFRIQETSSKYNASHELSLEMIQELLDKPQLLAFYYTKCK